MSKVAVIYWSGTGHTEAMAEAVAKGADGVLLTCAEVPEDVAAQYDAFALGCPAMGSEELEDMIATQHGAQVDCHFCNKRYEFTEAELQALLHQATGEER